VVSRTGGRTTDDIDDNTSSPRECSYLAMMI